ncbi:MAG: hypothetical protein ACREXX_13170 [Gammaproteobacteria bacterium]
MRLPPGTAILALVLALAAAFLSVPAHAIEDTEKALFGPIGVTGGQVVRVSMYAYGDPNDLPWDFVVDFFNVDGKLVQTIKRSQAPGVIGIADIAFGNPDERSGRRTLRVEIVAVNPQPDPPGAWSATLEVFDKSTGRTTVLLGGADTGYDMAP